MARVAVSSIDITFDFQSDTPPGRDPDAWSPMLCGYHKRLWNKRLPRGATFDLQDTTPGVCLHHRSAIGEFFLSSDAVVPPFLREPRLSGVLEPISVEARQTFMSLGYTMGGMMICPGSRIGRKNTINGARGFHPRIKDRFDLTVECIRRQYCGELSPLSDVLARYADFFTLFSHFRGYVEFFLLQDLVIEDCSDVRFFIPFEGFKTSPLPGSTEAYRAYQRLALDFIGARNQRIVEWCRRARPANEWLPGCTLSGCRSAFGRCSGAAEAISQPHLDQRLARHAETGGFAVERLHHPGREIHVDPLGNGADTARLAQVEVLRHLFAAVELLVKFFRFHRAQSPRLSSAAPRSGGYSRRVV